MRQVAIYLEAASKPGRPVFSLRVDDKTLELAEILARNDKKIRSVWKQEQQDAENRRTARWKEVREKQAKLVELDEELEKLYWRLADKKRELERTDQYENNTFSHTITSAWSSLDKECKDLDRQHSKKKQEIEKTEQPPDVVYQPLPQNESQALRVLFFLFTNVDVAHLMRAFLHYIIFDKCC